MAHRHTWRVESYSMLSLPSDDFAERFTAWLCTACPEYCTITGHVRVGTPLYWPEWWDRLRANEQLQGTPAARMAAQQLRAR